MGPIGGNGRPCTKACGSARHRRLSLAGVRVSPAVKITALLAAVALGPGVALAASNGGATAPSNTGLSGPTGLSGDSGPTGDTGATGHTGHIGPPTARTPPTPKLIVPVPAARLLRLQRVMTKAMKPVGAESGAYVFDLANGAVLFSDHATTPRNPASVEKLFTLTTVLARFGLDGTLTTSIYADGTMGAGGVFYGNLYLHGGGCRSRTRRRSPSP